jgi:signal transduction histidine kinase
VSSSEPGRIISATDAKPSQVWEDSTMGSDLIFDDVPADQRRRQWARWLVVVGLVIWSAGIALWELTWVGGLTASVAGGALLTYGLSTLAQGPRDANSPVWAVAVPVTISLVLISQGVGRAEFGARVMLVGLGTLGMIFVFLRILDDRLAIERQLAEHTLADERRRLAGDVHDVVGHTLSASMLHTAAARLSVRSDPDAAIASLERAEQQGRRSMDDIRSVVRLLRDDPGTNPPTPMTGELSELVESFRAGGADIAYSATGCLTDVPAPAALTVYRVVQEGLTNAVRHGTGTIEVTVYVTGADVDVEIVNDRSVRRAATTPGSGLVGMRERVEAIGGTLKVGGSNGDGRWVLRARIPT